MWHLEKMFFISQLESLTGITLLFLRIEADTAEGTRHLHLGISEDIDDRGRLLKGTELAPVSNEGMREPHLTELVMCVVVFYFL